MIKAGDCYRGEVALFHVTRVENGTAWVMIHSEYSVEPIVASFKEKALERMLESGKYLKRGNDRGEKVEREKEE